MRCTPCSARRSAPCSACCRTRISHTRSDSVERSTQRERTTPLNTTLTRRGFLKAGTGMLALSLLHLHWRTPAEAVADGGGRAEGLPDYRGWEDVYRQRWTWDKVAKGTHYVNCWYQRGCNWNIFVKDGI